MGDLNSGGRIPTVKRGRSLTFLNSDDAKTIWHTITQCKAPCNKTTGIAYPLANGNADFDSGELGTGPQGFSPASGKVSWKTPKGLRVGTYTYFCRIHPFMRGAFRVVR
jgi:plastocyanin